MQLHKDNIYFGFIKFIFVVPAAVRIAAFLRRTLVRYPIIQPV